MKVILQPRPVSIWMEPIEFGVMSALIVGALILLSLVRIHKRLRKIERIVTAL